MVGDRDALVSAAIETFAIGLRCGAQQVIAGACHAFLMEQDYYREQFYAAFDAFVSGTPLFR